VPTVVTLPATGASTNVTTLNAVVNPNGLATTYWFEYDLRDKLGKLSQTPQQSLSAGAKDIAVSIQLTGLVRHTVYGYRVVASNTAGTAVGRMMDFRTALPAALSSISVSPQNAALTVPSQSTQQFTATGTYSGGQTANVTNAVTWSSSNTGVATINAATGLATAVGTGTSTITAKSGSVSATATLKVNATLTVSKSGTGTGTVTSSDESIDCGATCSAIYSSVTSVTLTATPASGSTFAGWSGGGCSGTGTCTVTMSSGQTVTATFNVITYTLTVSTSGTGTGTVTSSPGGITCGSTCSATYKNGTSVTLTATAASGSIFGGWSGGGCAGTGTCTVVMSSSQSVTASFVPTGTTYTMSWNVQTDGTCSSRSSTIDFRLFDRTASPILFYPCTSGTGTQTGCTSTTLAWVISSTSTQVTSVSIVCAPGHWIGFGADLGGSDSNGYWGYGLSDIESCTTGNSTCGAYCAAATVTFPSLTCQ